MIEIPRIPFLPRLESAKRKYSQGAATDPRGNRALDLERAVVSLAQQQQTHDMLQSQVRLIHRFMALVFVKVVEPIRKDRVGMIAAAGISVVRLAAEICPPEFCQDGPGWLGQSFLPIFMLVEIQHEHGESVVSAGKVVFRSSLDMISDHFDLEDVSTNKRTVPGMIVMRQILLATLGPPVQGPPSLGDHVDNFSLPVLDTRIEDIHEPFDSVEARLMQELYWAC